MIDMPDQEMCERIALIAAEKDEEPLPVSKVMALFAAYNNVFGGDRLGLVRVDPESGSVATRIIKDRLKQWQIFNPQTGDLYYNLEPTLDWPEISTAVTS